MQTIKINPEKIIAKYQGGFWDVVTIKNASRKVVINRGENEKEVSFDECSIEIMTEGLIPDDGFKVVLEPDWKARGFKG